MCMVKIEGIFNVDLTTQSVTTTLLVTATDADIPTVALEEQRPLSMHI